MWHSVTWFNQCQVTLAFSDMASGRALHSAQHHLSWIHATWSLDVTALSRDATWHRVHQKRKIMVASEVKPTFRYSSRLDQRSQVLRTSFYHNGILLKIFSFWGRDWEQWKTALNGRHKYPCLTGTQKVYLQRRPGIVGPKTSTPFRKK